MKQFMLALFLAGNASGADLTQFVKSTYRFEADGSVATCWIVRHNNALVLVSAAHVFEKAKGEDARVILRKPDREKNTIAREPVSIRIRNKDQPLWVRHSKHDVAALRLAGVDNGLIEAISFDALAPQDAFEKLPPGTMTFTIGYPHAGQFDPPGPSYPLSRIGAVASYPMQSQFMVDYNTFEGDSGGPVVAESEDREIVIGIVAGQHMIDERYQTIYQQGLVRKRLGLAIVVGSPAVRETIKSVP